MLVIMQGTTAESLDGVNTKNPTCRVMLWYWCGRLRTVVPVLVEMKLEVFCCRPLPQAEPLRGR